jgi:16S rRNA (uracil1498-N3)-methyltransferase
VGDQAVLMGAEAHHLAHVMRAKPGTEVKLFDGSWVEYLARIERIGRGEVRLSVLSREAIDRELPYRLTLAVSLPKGDRQRWLIEKAVELGVTELVPLRTARSVAQPVEQVRARLRRHVVEASKQCGRNRLMEIADPADWLAFVAATRDVPLRWLAHPGSPAIRPAGRQPPTGGPPDRPICLAVGPEGGWTPEEVAAAVDAGWRCVGLGARILRIETAAVYLIARVAAEIDTHE